jgi:photosystem II stability/assembly factor-like uncharacterized protein
MNQPLERLYNLLPAIYRSTETGEGEPLRALLAVMEEELQIIEADINDLYENWFIETCAEWVVPYIGDLLDVQELYAENSRTSTQPERAYVANILAYRRRKGTAPVLEQLARDLTGWRGRVVEFVEILATTQNLNHVRTNSGFVDLRQLNKVDLLGTPFEQGFGYTAEVRRISSNRGRYNVRNIGLFLWRLQTYPIERGTALRIDDRRYTFNPLGDDNFPLFNQPQPETEITELAAEINVPSKLRRLALGTELKLRQQALLNGQSLSNNGYLSGWRQPVIQVFINGQLHPISLDEMLITALPNQEASHDWQLPTNNSEFPTKVVAIDPELGRLAFLDRTVPTQVEVSYAYGFSGDIGGGPYDRTIPLERDSTAVRIPPSSSPPLTWDIELDKSAQLNPLAEAVQSWNQTVAAWQGCQNHTSLILSSVSTAIAIITTRSHPSLRPQMTPGIINGLTAIATPGTTEVFVTPGIAVDGQGRAIALDKTQQIDLKPYQSPTGVVSVCLVISYRAAQNSPNWQIDILPAAAKGSFILLKNLDIEPGGKIASATDSDTHPFFTPGIVSGFQLVLKPGLDNSPSPPGILFYDGNPAMEAVLTAGVAVDSQGKTISLTKQRIDLKPYQNQTVFLILFYNERSAKPSWEIKIVPEADAKSYPPAAYIYLAYLAIPQVKINQLDTSRRISSPPGIIKGLDVTAHIGSRTAIVSPGIAVDSQGRCIELDLNCCVNLRRYSQQTVQLVISYNEGWLPPKWQIRVLSEGTTPDADDISLARLTLGAKGKILNQPDTQVRIYCCPGIVQGLEVITPNSESAIVEITPGVALDKNGQIIRLRKNRRVDLSAYPGQNLTLFISQQPGQIGIVPQEPQASDTGVITLRDNHTYSGDLRIDIPADKHLHIIAANGDRPHIRGNLFVEGTAPGDSQQPGEFTLEGLLVEGKLTVGAGNLKRLHLIHSTLVPKNGGLVVEKNLPPVAEPEPEPEDWLMAVVMYLLNLIRSIIYQMVMFLRRSPEENLAELSQLVRQQVDLVLSALQEFVETNRIRAASRREGHEGRKGQEGKRLSERFCVSPKLLCGAVDKDNDQISIYLHHSICGSIKLADTVLSLNIVDSIIDTGVNDQLAISAIGSATTVDLKTTTILGSTAVNRLEASNCIFNGKVTVQRQQVGCMRFCYLPESSHTPRRYRCQPDMVLDADLNSQPAAVTALAINPNNGYMFAGTAGDGIFRYTNNSWELVEHPDLTNLNVTSLIFDSNLFVGSANGEIFRSADNGVNWEKITNVSSNTAVTALVLTGNYLFIGTGGNGVFGLPITGDGSQAENLGLSNQHITALAIDTTGKVFSGTGDGIFCFSPNDRSWTAVNNNLMSRQITALAVYTSGAICVGTADGQIYRSTNYGETWQKIYTDSFSAPITSLVTDELLGTGTISSEGVMVTGHGTLFVGEITIGSTITALGQTKKVISIISDTTITIDTAFYPNLPSETLFNINRRLFAGTANGRILISAEDDSKWSVVYLDDVTQTDITSLVINANNRREMFASTTVGSILHSSDRGTRWTTVNQGLKNVNDKLLILNRLQPGFNSEVYGNPGYAQLSLICAQEIQTGADDRSEMGVFNYLQQPQRAAALRNSLEEYLRFGMELGIFYMT